MLLHKPWCLCNAVKPLIWNVVASWPQKQMPGSERQSDWLAIPVPTRTTLHPDSANLRVCPVKAQHTDAGLQFA